MKKYWEALKIVLLPMAGILGIATAILWFAAGAWVRGIVQEEIGANQVTTSEQATKLTEHAGLLEQHDEEIEDNEETIKSNDARFTDFVREILSKL